MTYSDVICEYISYNDAITYNDNSYHYSLIYSLSLSELFENSSFSHLTPYWVFYCLFTEETVGTTCINVIIYCMYSNLATKVTKMYNVFTFN